MKLRSGTKFSRGTCQPPASRRSGVERRSLRRVSRLTERNLKALTQEFDMPRRKHSATSSAVTSRTTTTDKEFPLRLQENNIYGDRPTTAPNDLDELRAFLERPRESRSPDTNDHVAYIETVDGTDNEATMEVEAWNLLSKHPGLSGVSGYRTARNFEWTECDNKFTDSGLSNPKPDITESLQVASYHSAAREGLGASLAPTLYRHATPHIAVEYKGPNGSMVQAKHQSAYNGATMTEACLQISEHMAVPLQDFYGRTQALTLASNGVNLEVFANHATEQHPNTIAYHQHRVASLGTDTLDEYRTAYRYVRNAQDWARARAVQTRDELSTYHEDPQAKTGWTWSVEYARYFRIVDGNFEWAPAPDALTPPTSDAPSSTKKKSNSKAPVKKGKRKGRP